MSYKAAGTPGFILSILLMLGMTALGLFEFPVDAPGESLGLCLLSPNLWNIPQPWSAIANAALLLAVAAGLIVFNKNYNFVGGHDLVYPAAFLVITASNPWLTHYLNASAILAAGNLLCLSILFSCYSRRDNQNASFYLASVIGWGSMVQYAFVPYALVYLLAAVMLKVMKGRDVIAYLLGLCAPYWILFGCGIVPVSSFHFPDVELYPLSFAPPVEVVTMLVATGFTMLLGIILLFNNAVSLGSTSSKARAFNRVVNFVGIASAIFMVLDFTNMMAYIPTMTIAVGIQLANAFSYASLKRPGWLAAALAAVYVGLFLVIVYV